MELSEAYRLLDRLLQDPAFRASFDADPVGAARAAGLHEMAQELALDRTDPMQTLELRESKSSLAGALMAAAAEGLGFFAATGLGFVDQAQAAVPPAPAAENVALIGQAQPAAAAASPDAELARQALEQAGGKSPASSALPPTGDPDDLQGELDDEDAGADEQDGSTEVEPDEGSDDEGSDDEGSDDKGSDDEGSDDEGSDDEGSDDEGDDEYDDDEDANDAADGDDDTDDEDDEDSADDSADEHSADGSDAGSAGDEGDLSSAPEAYPGDDAPREEIAAWMAERAQARGLPPELPVMAALVESGMQNLDHGDADSVGLFQMRESIWDSGAYSGYQDSPELQLKWFLDQAEAVKKQRLAAGRSLGPKNYGSWIADIERPAEQYRGRYQLQLDEARLLLEKSAGDRPSGGNDAHVLSAIDASEAQVRADIVVEAKAFVGTPYVWGGASPRGFDCSGFVQFVYKRMGVDLPRVSNQQASSGQRISLPQLRKGDLVAWDNSARNRGADHIAIYLGNGRIAEAPRPGVPLRVRSLGAGEGAWGVRVLGGRHG